jgi:translation initiation factor IF-2
VKRLQLEAEEERLQRAEEGRKREEQEARTREEDERRRVEENRRAEEAAEQQRALAATGPAQAEPEPAAAAPEAVPTTDADDDPADKTEAAPAARRFTPVERTETKRPEVKSKKKDDKRAAPIDAEKDKRRDAHRHRDRTGNC